MRAPRAGRARRRCCSPAAAASRARSRRRSNDFPPRPATTTSRPTPARRSIEEVRRRRARRSKPAALWGLLSTATKQRVGPLRPVPRPPGDRARRGLGGFRDFKVIVSERVTPEFGVVAIDGTKVAEGTTERDVYAVALRLEATEWKVELFGPVKVRPIGPDPGAHEDVVAQIAAAVSGQAGDGTALVYVDGLSENPKIYGTASRTRRWSSTTSRHSTPAGTRACSGRWGVRRRRPAGGSRSGGRRRPAGRLDEPARSGGAGAGPGAG